MAKKKPKKPEKWMQAAVPESHRGIFTAKAHRAGMGVQAYARKEEHAPGKLGKQARFALRAKEVAASHKHKHHGSHHSSRDSRYS